jgi:hypothetical protein
MFWLEDNSHGVPGPAHDGVDAAQLQVGQEALRVLHRATPSEVENLYD